jgi:hypothetical protein
MWPVKPSTIAAERIASSEPKRIIPDGHPPLFFPKEKPVKRLPVFSQAFPVAVSPCLIDQQNMVLDQLKQSPEQSPSFW